MQISVLKRICELKKINYTGLTKYQMMVKCGLSSSIPKTKKQPKLNYINFSKPNSGIVAKAIKKKEEELKKDKKEIEKKIKALNVYTLKLKQLQKAKKTIKKC